MLKFGHTLQATCLALITCLVMVAAMPAHAFLLDGNKDGKSSSFAIVNVARLMSESKAAKALNSELQAELKAFKADTDRKEQALVKENETISENDKAAFQKFRAKVEKMKAATKAKREAIDERSGKALTTLRDTILKIVKEISDKNGYDAVFAQQNVVLMSGNINLTDEVMSELDKRLPTLSMK